MGHQGRAHTLGRRGPLERQERLVFQEQAEPVVSLAIVVIQEPVGRVDTLVQVDSQGSLVKEPQDIQALLERRVRLEHRVHLDIAGPAASVERVLILERVAILGHRVTQGHLEQVDSQERVEQAVFQEQAEPAGSLAIVG